MKEAKFTIKLEDNYFIFDSEQNTTQTIKEIYIKKLKNKYPNFNFDVCVVNDEDYDDETEEYGIEHLKIIDGKVIHK